MVVLKIEKLEQVVLPIISETIQGVQKHRLLPLPFLVHAIPHAAANPVPVEPQLTLKNGALRYVGIASMGLFNPYNVVCLEGRFQETFEPLGTTFRDTLLSDNAFDTLMGIFATNNFAVEFVSPLARLISFSPVWFKSLKVQEFQHGSVSN